MSENLIYVGDILKRAGSSKQVGLTFVGDEFITSFVKVVGKVTCSFTLESITNGILVKGSIYGRYEAKCGYGLEDFERDFEFQISELFQHGHDLTGIKSENSNFASADDEDDEEDFYSFEAGDIDVTQLVIDNVMTNLPMAPVCSDNPEDCTEFKEEILPYIPKVQASDKAVIEEVAKIDPRWAALDEMFENLDLDDKNKE